MPSCIMCELCLHRHGGKNAWRTSEQELVPVEYLLGRPLSSGVQAQSWEA